MMASSAVRLQPTVPFNLKAPDYWPCWRRLFQQFREASGLATEGDMKQVFTLLYCMGETAEDVLTSADISKYNRKRFDSVITKFDNCFKVRKNVIFEHAGFTRHSQEDSELAEDFITSLYQLVENCEYGALPDQMISDQVVVGIHDQALFQRMHVDPISPWRKQRPLVTKGRQLGSTKIS